MSDINHNFGHNKFCEFLRYFSSSTGKLLFFFTAGSNKICMNAIILSKRIHFLSHIPPELCVTGIGLCLVAYGGDGCC